MPFFNGIYSLPFRIGTNTPTEPQYSGQVGADFDDLAGIINNGPFLNVKNFGAVGDAITDDTDSVNAAFSAADAAGGGTVYFPPGTYLTTTGFIANCANTMRLYGVAATLITRNDVTVLSFNAADQSVVDGINIIGKGAGIDTGTFGATVPALEFLAPASTLSHSIITGGNPPCLVDTNDNRVMSCEMGYSMGQQVCIFTQGGTIHASSFDQNFPGIKPPANTVISAWAPATPYAVDDVVILTNAGDQYIVQCTVAGTSGGTAPALKNYGIDIPDGAGALVWQLGVAVGITGINLPTGSTELHCDMLDNSWPIGMGGGTELYISNSVVNGIIADSGSKLFLWGNELFNPAFNTNGACVHIDSGFGGEVAIYGNNINGGGLSGSIGVSVRGGINTKITGNSINDCDIGVNIDNNITDFVISNNTFDSDINAVIVEAGTSDFYVIANNLVHNSTNGVTDGGTGINKVVSGNL